MNRKPYELDLTEAGSDISSQFTKNTSFINNSPFNQNLGFKLDSPKMFQRKPTFKTFQRRQKRQSCQDSKICYISPQKSELFKKYGNFGENLTQLGSSRVTENSNGIFERDQTKSQSKPLSLLLDLKQTQSILTDINNMKSDQGFMTPKNTRNEYNFSSPNNLKKSAVKKLRSQKQCPYENSEPDFDKNFTSLHQFKEPRFSSYGNSRISYCESDRKPVNHNLKQQKENYSPQMSYENFHSDKKTGSFDLEIQIEKLRNECAKMKLQKNQLEDSSQIFLEEIMSLQTKLQKEIKEKENVIEQSNLLKQKLAQKNTEITNLNIEIRKLESINQNKQSEEALHFKAMYIQLSQKLKYMTVENDILKKMLEEKKDDNFKIERLQTLNKKLTARNKFLTKELEDIQTESLQTKKGIKKTSFPINLQKNKYAQRQSMKNINENVCKTPNKKSVEGRLTSLQGIPASQIFLDNVCQEIDSIDKISLASNGSSLQLSFELSPQKNFRPFKCKDQEGIKQFKTLQAFK